MNAKRQQVVHLVNEKLHVASHRALSLLPPAVTPPYPSPRHVVHVCIESSLYVFDMAHVFVQYALYLSTISLVNLVIYV